MVTKDVPSGTSQDAVTLVEKALMAVELKEIRVGMLAVVTAVLIANLQENSSFGEDAGQVARPSESEDNASEDKASDNGATPAPAVLTGTSVESTDRFVVPTDGDAKKLFAFIRSIRQDRSMTRDQFESAARAVASAAEAIRRIDELPLGAERNAIREQLAALRFLATVDPSSLPAMQAIVESLQADPRPSIARLADVEAFKFRIRGIRSASRKEQTRLIEELKELLGDHEFDRDAFNVASLLVRGIGSSENVDLAAELYDDLAAVMSQSKDESIRGRAEKMVGAARRMRLPGNFMEVTGMTCEGGDFDWNAYRGKVVLVHFWASWCRRCRGELPRLKRVFQKYSDEGFDIVGINLDRRREACSEFVASENLEWTNLTGRDESERGWDSPLAKQYGISAIPTAILVDPQGNVISLNARGEDLERTLAEQFAKPALADATDTEG